MIKNLFLIEIIKIILFDFLLALDNIEILKI